MKSRDTFAPIGPVPRHRRRDPRSAQAAGQAVGERRAQAELQHRRHGAQDPALHRVGHARSTRSSRATSSRPAPTIAALSAFQDGDTVELETEGLGKLRINVRDELKRTWARETRLDRRTEGLERHDAAADRQIRAGAGVTASASERQRSCRAMAPKAVSEGSDECARETRLRVPPLEKGRLGVEILSAVPHCVARADRLIESGRMGGRAR